MKIGIDASRAFLKNRTGIEEYSYQIIWHLQKYLQKKQVILYIRKDQQARVEKYKWPENWQVKVISWPRFWTQMGLSLEMFLHPVGALLVPAHTVPIIHPQKTVVTVHGLEYEFIANGYSWWDKFYMKWSIKMSCKWASSIICVSQNTKKDLMRLYGVLGKKINVIYEGYADKSQMQNLKSQTNSNDEISNSNTKYLLFIGRIEERKNIANIVEAFNSLKEKHGILHKLILAGKPGFGYEKIKNTIQKSSFKKEILELGYISEEEKWELLKKADVFVFPTRYEGFGIPILEAQSVGCPVVAADNSAIPEVTCDSALLTHSADSHDIADSIYKLLSDEKLKNAIIQKGLANTKRFSWEKCAQEIAEVVLS